MTFPLSRLRRIRCACLGTVGTAALAVFVGAEYRLDDGVVDLSDEG